MFIKLATGHTAFNHQPRLKIMQLPCAAKLFFQENDCCIMSNVAK